MRTSKKNINSDSINARCWGLAGGTARKKNDNSKVSATDVLKEEGPFFCPVCLSEAIVRKCTEKADHFAHKGRLSPTITSRDQKLHDKCRDDICNYLKSVFPEGKWEAERPIPAKKSRGWEKEIIPDLSGRFGNKNSKPIAIEIQKTAYTIKRIHDKTIEYSKRGIFVIWIVPLNKDLGEKPFRPRLYEKYLHSMYYGRTYYWTPNSSPKIIPVHFSPTKRWIDETIWFDKEYGEEQTAGGFYLTYKTLKSPNYGQFCNLDKEFKLDYRKRFTPKNKKKEIPNCKILVDKNEKWWPKDEYKDMEKQKTLITNTDFLSDYEYFDDYDDETYE